MESSIFSPLRLFGYAHRETLEIRRDPVRLTFALLGTVILMFIMGYGITMDVDDISFAVLDRDQTPESRDYIAEYCRLALLYRAGPRFRMMPNWNGACAAVSSVWRWRFPLVSAKTSGAGARRR